MRCSSICDAWRIPRACWPSCPCWPGHLASDLERPMACPKLDDSGFGKARVMIVGTAGHIDHGKTTLVRASLLGIRSGAVVITKCDRASPARIEEVGRQIADLVSGTPLAQAPLFPTAAHSGDGIEPLRRWLVELAVRTGPPDKTGQAF